jgi:cytochrome c oxidase subunit 5b
MLRSAVRAARPAVFAARSSFQPKSSTRFRPFSTTLPVSSGPPAPQLFGEGGKAGEVPSDYEQATGLERLQLLGELEGVDVFDESPLDASRIGTKANPILVPSHVRIFVFSATSLDCPHLSGQLGRGTYSRLHRFPGRFA